VLSNGISFGSQQHPRRRYRRNSTSGGVNCWHFKRLREQAFEAAERSYQQTARDLGYSEAAANGWISAVMFRLRGKVTELIENRLNPAASSPEQKIL